jgi:hypothetical protein
VRKWWQQMAENQIQTPDDENEPEEDPLLVREAQLIEMLARGMKVAEASRRTGMSLSTIHRRLRCRKFKAQVDEFREDLMSGAASRTAGLMDQALDTLAELMDAQQTPGGANAVGKVRARNGGQVPRDAGAGKADQRARRDREAELEGGLMARLERRGCIGHNVLTV